MIVRGLQHSAPRVREHRPWEVASDRDGAWAFYGYGQEEL